MFNSFWAFFWAFMAISGIMFWVGGVILLILNIKYPDEN